MTAVEELRAENETAEAELGGDVISTFQIYIGHFADHQSRLLDGEEKR
jgi:hypothetical protein